MRILFLVPHDYEKIGGFYLPLNNYKKGLEELGHFVLFYSFPYRLKHFASKGLRNDLKNIVINQKIDTVIGFTLNISYIYLRFVRDNSYDVQDVAFLMDSMRLHAESIIKTQRFGFGKILNKLKKIVYTNRERYCLRHYKKNLYVSIVDYEYVLKHYHVTNIIDYIPNGMVLQEKVFVSNIHSTSLNVGLLTGFSPDTLNNNVYPFLFSFFPEIKERIPSIKFVLAGRGADKETIDKILTIKGVEYLGYVENLEDFYSQIDVVITTVNKSCGILNRVLEAWSFGKVVVGFKRNFAAFPESLPNKHYLIADSIQEFVKVFSELIDGSIDSNTIGNNALCLVKEHYDWQTSVKKLNQLLKR